MRGGRSLLGVAAAALLTGAAGRPALAASNPPLPLPCPPLVQPPLCTAAPPPSGAPLPNLLKPSAAPTPAKPSATPSPSPKPTPGGGLGMVGVIDDPALSAKVANVLQHPVSADRPSLLHFLGRTPSAAGTRAGTHRATGASGWAVAAWVTLLVLLLAAASALVFIRRSTRRTLGRAAASARHGLGQAAAQARHAAGSSRTGLEHAGESARHTLSGVLPAATRLGGGIVRGAGSLASRLLRTRSRQMAAVGVTAPALILLVGLILPATSRSPQPSPATGRGHQAVQVSRHQVPSATSQLAEAPATADGWSRLVDIEQELDITKQQLASQETQVSALTAQLQHEPAASPQVPQLTTRLQQVVAAHESLTQTYNNLLQTEYEFFAGAAKNPPVRKQLVATAVASGQPDAPPAVQYDLNIVEAQENQEAALAAAEAAAAASPVTDTITSLLGSVGRPRLISPMGGSIAQCFGPTAFDAEPPVSAGGHFYPHFHTGIDIDAPEGTPVRAAAPGRVILATSSVGDNGQLVGYGRYVAISHGHGFTTVYGHLESIDVHPGGYVKQGDVIGHEGSTGNSTGPHLHFETRVGGSAVNPAPYLRGVLHGC